MKAFHCLAFTLSLLMCARVAAADNSPTSATNLAKQSGTEETSAIDSVAEADALAARAVVSVNDNENADEAIVEFSPAHIAWMLICSALVLMMTAPGLALFYGGLVRKKNILSVLMQCVFLMGMMTLLWAVVGYSLAFGGSHPYWGDFSHVFLNGVLPTFADGNVVTPGEGTKPIPDAVFMVFQGMFFIITPALICGAFAERLKFSTMCVFSALWGLLVYCPICHWVWSDSGWLCEWNKDALFPALDFAGGTVVHVSSGVSALVCAMFIGQRMNYGSVPMPPHNLTYTCIGAALLWVGWFGFNAGSALAPNTMAVNAFVATHFAAAAGVVSWALAEWILRGKATMLGGCSGAIAGLVCITPACGSVSAISAIIIGLIGGLVCCWACTGLKHQFKYDDSLDAFGVHGLGGTVGALLTGVFASRSITGELHGGRVGLIESGFANWEQLLNQVVSIGAAAGLAIIGTVILLMLLNVTMGLRVTPEEEQRGLDIAQHGEEGYIFL